MGLLGEFENSLTDSLPPPISTMSQAAAVTISATDSATNASSIGSVSLPYIASLASVTVTHVGSVGSVTFNTPGSAAMSVNGPVVLGNSATVQARGIGNIVFNNIAKITGALTISTRAVPTATYLGSVRFVADSLAPLVIDGTVTVTSNVQSLPRPVEFVNLKSIQVVNSQGTFINAYSDAGATYGPVTVNGKEVHLKPNAAYLTLSGINDPDCINKCKGRGSAYAGNSSCTTLAVCGVNS